MNILELVKSVLNRDAFLGVLPDKPDKAIVLTQYGGGVDTFFDQTDEVYQVQARCRAMTAPEAYAMAETVKAALDRYVGQGVAIRQITPILDIGQDERRRREYTVNFTINPIGG